MIITTTLAYVVARDLLGWSVPFAALITAAFLFGAGERARHRRFHAPLRRVIPPALLHSLKHYKALHKQVMLLTVMTEEVSHLNDDERLVVEDLGEGIFRVTCRYGYMEEADIPALLERVGRELHVAIPPMDTTYFLGRETLIVTSRESGMANWREIIFASMMRNAESAARFFRLPPNRVVELGAQIEF
jgi:KUP system potassium uptake protein